MLLRIGAAILAATLSIPPGFANDITRETLAFARPSTETDLIGQEEYVRAQAEDTIADIGLIHALGYREMQLANRNVDLWLPGSGTLVTLPKRFVLPAAERRGIVINVPEMRLYFYPESDPQSVVTFPVSVGRDEWPTPTGSTMVISKTLNPAWYPSDSIRAEHLAVGEELPLVVPPGPDNPLGRYSLNLAIPGIFIHGTNRPYGIGMKVTHGCIRMHPLDMELLYPLVVSKETPVTFVRQRFKVGWDDGVLYLEVHGVADGDDAAFAELEAAVVRATGPVEGSWVNWTRARELARQVDGLPHPIGGDGNVGTELSSR